ncbi:hypothetical protein ACTHR6_16000 [Ralstonia holmesii]|uniref:hypothetical protein n=1 Tax=Ralstonia TaxID=48736 RepID=UPI00046A62EE|nr:hypothetical protein [Ralstonia pickettii]
MTKSLRDLLLDLDALNREIHRVRHKEISSDTMAVRFPQASAATRRRLQALLSAPPQRRGITASDHRAQLFTPKVFLRTLLFATSKRGRIVESLYVTVTRDETQYNFRNATQHNFNVWVYGEREKLVRGSGLFVGETGVEANHHFLPSPDIGATLFAEGCYRVDVFAHLLGDKRQRLLLSQSLIVTPELARQLQCRDAGLRFDWAPDSSRYVATVDERPPQASPRRLQSGQGTPQPAFE